METVKKMLMMVINTATDDGDDRGGDGDCHGGDEQNEDEYDNCDW